MQLTADIDSTDRWLHLDGAYEPTSRYSYIECEGERMTVIRGDGTDTLYVRRGAAGTSAAAHDSGSTVTAVGGAAGPHTHTHAATTSQGPDQHHDALHAADHATGEADELAPAAIGAATSGHAHSGVYLEPSS